MIGSMAMEGRWTRRELARWYRSWSATAGSPATRQERVELAAYLDRLADEEEAAAAAGGAADPPGRQGPSGGRQPDPGGGQDAERKEP
jgi:hypothetical protein